MAKDNRQIIKLNGKDTFVEAMRSCFYSDTGNKDENGKAIIFKDRVLLNFQQYDNTKPTGSKTVADVKFYISFDNWHMLTGMITSGALFRQHENLPEIKKYHEAVERNKQITEKNTQIAITNALIESQNTAMSGVTGYKPMAKLALEKAITIPSGFVNTPCYSLEGGSPTTKIARRFSIGPSGKLPCGPDAKGKLNYVLLAQQGPGTVNATTGGITMSSKPTDLIRIMVTEEDLTRMFTTVDAEIQAHMNKRHSVKDLAVINENESI